MKFLVDLCHHEETTWEVEAETASEAIERAKRRDGTRLHTDSDEVCHEYAARIAPTKEEAQK